MKKYLNLHFISTLSSISLFLFTSIAHLISGSPDVQLARRPCLECEMIKQVKWNFFFWTKFLLDLVRSKATFQTIVKNAESLYVLQGNSMEVGGACGVCGVLLWFHILRASKNYPVWFILRTSKWELGGVIYPSFFSAFSFGLNFSSNLLGSKIKSRNSMVTFIERWFHLTHNQLVNTCSLS